MQDDKDYEIVDRFRQFHLKEYDYSRDDFDGNPTTMAGTNKVVDINVETPIGKGETPMVIGLNSMIRFIHHLVLRMIRFICDMI